MIRKTRFSRVKRPTCWQGGYATPGQIFTPSSGVPSGNPSFLQMTYPFTGDAVVGRPTMNDPVLQRTNLDFSMVFSGTAQLLCAAIGVIVVSVGSAGTVVGTQPVPNPMVDTDADWILHAFLGGDDQLGVGNSLRWGANFGGPGSRIESKARRRLRDTDVLVLCLAAQGTVAPVQFEAGWRCLFKGR